MTKSNYSYLNLFVRSIIMWFCSVLSIIIFSLIIVCAWPLKLKYRFKIITVFMRIYMFLLRHICHLDYKVIGLENLQSERNGIVMAKHQSTWETFFLPIYFWEVAAIGKQEIAWVPFFGWAFAASEPIAINRSKTTSAMQQVIKKGKRCLAAGRWIMVFPEGTRIPYGKVGQYKLGGARLAVATGYPVQLVAHNAGLFWPRRTFIKRPGTITVVISPLMESTGKTPEGLMEEAKQWIENTIATLPT